MSERYDQDDYWQNRIAAALQAVGPSESIAAETDASIEARLDAVEADPFSEAEVDRILDKARQAIGDQSLAAPAVARDVHSSEDPVSEHSAAEDSGMVGDDPMKRTVRVARGVDGNGQTAPSGMSSVVVVVSVCASLLAAVGLFQVKSVIDDDSRQVATQNGDDSLVPVNAEFDSVPGLKPQPRPEVSQLALVDAGSTIRTGEREKRRVQLPDGSVVYVNEQTHVSVLKDRGLKLHDGEVFVEVMPKTLLAADFDDDFIVQAADRSVRATGTRFAVSADGNESDVLVTQGSVQVSEIKEEIVAGQELFIHDGDHDDRYTIAAAPRASESLSWTRDLVTAADAGLVPDSEHAGGSITVVDPNGQEMRLSLRTVHVDVHIEDGFARTTIDQTYFNHTFQRQEGTFHFPLPADASLSRLAMYVNGRLMEGGMAERQHARNVFEQIRYTRRDPALLEWVDGSTFKMRVFPLEARQEKRIVLSYTQRLPNDYGRTVYRFPAGHSLERVRDWSTQIQVAHPEKYVWDSPSHVLNESAEETLSLVLEGQTKNEALDRDLVLELRPAPGARKRQDRSFRFSSAEHEAFRYLMLRFRPELEGELKRAKRNWVFLFETTGDRNPLLARVQIDVIRTFLENAEHDDTFSIIRAGTKSQALNPNAQVCSAKNIERALKRLEDSHLVGALDFGTALDACQKFCQDENSWIVHAGSGIPVIGERDEAALVDRIPKNAKYVGVGVGNRWAQTFMKSAASGTGGHFTQINPDEEVVWRAFELYSTLSAPRLLEARVTARDGKRPITFLNFADTIAHGQELAAATRLPAGQPLPKTVTVTGMLNGEEFEQTLNVVDVEEGADYLPRSWARLEIDRLVAQNAEANKQAIISLSKTMYVMSPFTSLLVLETEQMYQQFAVDRGRKDHWALYPAPKQIDVVHEPNVQGPVNLTYLPDVEQELLKVRKDRDEAREKLERSLRDRKADPLIRRLKVRFKELQHGTQLLEQQVSHLKQAAGDKVSSTAKSVVFRRQAPRGFGLGKVVKPQHIVWSRVDPRFFDFDVQDSIGGPNFDNRLGEIDFGLEVDWIDSGLINAMDSRNFWGFQPATVTHFLDVDGDGLQWNVDPQVWNRLQEQQRRFRRRDLLQRLNRRHRNLQALDGDIANRIAAYELAYRMQEQPDLANLMLQQPRFATVPGGLSWAVDGQSSTVWLTEQHRAWVYPEIRNLDLWAQPQGEAGIGMDFGTYPILDSYNIPVNGRNKLYFDFTGPQVVQNQAFLTFATTHRPIPIEYRRSVDTYFLTVFGRPQKNATAPTQEAIDKALATELAQRNALLRSDVLAGLVDSGEFDPPEQRARMLFIPQQQQRQQWADWRGPQNVPVAIHIDSVLGELVSHAPGLETTLADALAVLENECRSETQTTGQVDPEARLLIEKARSGGWESVVIPGRSGQADVIVQCDGTGRFRIERLVSERLKETVVGDGKSLWHLYSGIGLAAQRSMSQFHRADLSLLIPWIVQPVDDLRQGANVKLVDDRTVALVPIRQAEAKSAPLWHVQLVFAKDGRLAERRTVEIKSGKVLSRLVIGTGGALELFAADGKRIGGRMLKRTALQNIPDLDVETDELVVLPLPYRTAVEPLDEIPADISGKDKPEGKRQQLYARLSEAAAMQHVAAAFAAGDAETLINIIKQRFFSRNDRRVGFLTLLACAAPKNSFVMNTLKQRISEPVPQFLSQYHAWRSSLNLNVEFVVNPKAPEFIQRLAEGHNHFLKWAVGRATKDRTDAQIRDELGRVLVYVRRCQNPRFAWRILSTIHSRLKNDGRIEGEFGRRLTNELARLETRTGLENSSELRIRWMLESGQTDEVVALHEQLLTESVRKESFPGLRQATYELFKSRLQSTAAWQQAVRAVGTILREESRKRELLALAQQCRDLGENELGDEFFAQALDKVDLQKNVDMLAAAFEYSRRAQRWEQAEGYVQTLLKDKGRSKLSELWRRAAEVAAGREDRDESLRRLEHAMNLEFQSLPESINVEAFRTDYSSLFDRFDGIVKSNQKSGRELPGDLTDRVIRVGDRWRSIDPDDTAACQRIARVLSATGNRELAWDYWTTPLAQKANDSGAWMNLAVEMRDGGRFALAGRAFTEAFRYEQTNPQILWEHAQMLIQQKNVDAARTLLRQIAEGSWQPRFQPTKQQATAALQAL